MRDNTKFYTLDHIALSDQCFNLSYKTSVI